MGQSVLLMYLVPMVDVEDKHSLLPLGVEVINGVSL